MGVGSEVTRAPRLALEGDERERIIALFEDSAARRPEVKASVRHATGWAPIREQFLVEKPILRQTKSGSLAACHLRT